MPLFGQLKRVDSVPVQPTSSSKMSSIPAPNAALPKASAPTTTTSLNGNLFILKPKSVYYLYLVELTGKIYARCMCAWLCNACLEGFCILQILQPFLTSFVKIVQCLKLSDNALNLPYFNATLQQSFFFI